MVRHWGRRWLAAGTVVALVLGASGGVAGATLVSGTARGGQGALGHALVVQRTRPLGQRGLLLQRRCLMSRW